MTHGKKSIYAFFFLSVLWLFGCSTEHGNKRPVFILGVDVRASGGQSGVKFDTEKCQEYLATALEESSHLRPVAKRSDKAMRLQAIIEIASEQEPKSDDDSGVYRAVQVQLRLTPSVGSDAETLRSTGKAFLVQDSDSVQRNEGFALVYNRAVDNAVKYLDVQMDAADMSIEDIRKNLVSSDPQRRLYILRTLRNRKTPQLHDDVLRLLRDPDNEVALEAIGVLVEQRDQEAVIPLIRMSHRRDPVFLLQLISALSELGGPVARGYLFTLAAGHGSTDIRQRAKEALAGLEKSPEDDSRSESQSLVLSTKPNSTSTKNGNGGQK